MLLTSKTRVSVFAKHAPKQWRRLRAANPVLRCCKPSISWRDNSLVNSSDGSSRYSALFHSHCSQREPTQFGNSTIPINTWSIKANPFFPFRTYNTRHWDRRTGQVGNIWDEATPVGSHLMPLSGPRVSIRNRLPSERHLLATVLAAHFLRLLKPLTTSEFKKSSSQELVLRMQQIVVAY